MICVYLCLRKVLDLIYVNLSNLSFKEEMAVVTKCLRLKSAFVQIGP